MVDDNLSPCPYCAELIQRTARKCRFCGEFLDPVLRAEARRQAVPIVASVPAQKSTGVAALLSLVLPGAGQIYLGKLGLGFAFLFFTGFAYVVNIAIGLAPVNASDPIGPEFFLSGIAALSLHIGSVVTAAKAR